MDYTLLSIAGLIAGVAGGMLGIGGSIIMIPAMNELFGLHQHLHQAAAMIVNFFVVVPAAYQHTRAGAVQWRVVAALAPAAIIGVGAGVGISELPMFDERGQRYLASLFGLFLFSIAIREAVRLFGSSRKSDDVDGSAPVSRMRAALCVGIPTGLIAGLLGVGGGIVAVPLQRRLLGAPLRNAIANSAATIIPISIIGAMLKNAAVMGHPDIDWRRPLVLAAILIPTAMCGSLIGSRLTHKLPIRYVRIAFIFLLAAFGVRMGKQALL